MKKLILPLFLLLLLTCMALPVSAADTYYEEQLFASGAADVWEALPQNTREFLRSVGITGLEPEEYTALQPGALWNTLTEVFAGQIGNVLVPCGLVFGAVVLMAVADAMRHSLRDTAMTEAFSLCGVLAVCGVVLVPISTCIRQVGEAADGAAVFLASFVPAYAAILIASGQPTLAASYNTLLLTGAEVSFGIIRQLALPLLTVALGIGTVGSVCEKSRVSPIAAALAKAAGWFTVTVTALFTALLAFQSTVAVSADSVGQRAAKMTVSSFVPLVGGVLSETVGTVTGCLRLLRSTLGMLGAAATVALVLPAAAGCVAWLLSLRLCRIVAELCGVSSVNALLAAVQSALRALVGILASFALFMIVSVTVVTITGGSI